MIRVLIADDQALVRAGFRMILDAEEDIDVIGDASDGAEAVEQTKRLDPDVVLMDIRMPELDGIEATRRVIAGGGDSPPRVLMLTTFDLNEYVYEALRAGASGFLLKDVPPEELAAGIRIVARGDALLAPAITKRLIPEFARAAPAAGAARRLRRADRARGRGLQARRARALERRDRRRAGGERDDGQDARRAAADEARHPRPRAGRRARLRVGHRRAGGYGVVAWWQSAVVYQIYPRSFADSDGDGIGDLPGILGRLDHLAELGVDVIWLSPVYPSPQDDNGYDISDYQDIDPTFGTLEDFDALLAAIHERGMKLVMDLVVNHTSDEHPWFVESRSSRDNPKRDWYWWRDQPTNWRSFFSGPTWELDEATGQYYLHLFSRKQPDLNWENPEVRQAIYSMMRWWLDRGVDGFRMDVINMISKDPALPDAPGGDGSPYYICGPRIHEFLQEMHREVFEGRDAELLTVGEMPGVTLENAKLFTDPARGEVDMVFQFEHVQLDQGASKWDVHPLELRDLKRVARPLAGRAGRDGLEQPLLEQPRPAAGGLALRGRQPSGGQDARHGAAPAPRDAVRLPGRGARDDELPVRRDRGLPRHRVAQPLRRGEARSRSRRCEAMGRDNARTPMQWDASEHAGFTTGTPWLAVNPNHDEINAEAERGDPDSVFHHYRRLIELRHSEPAVVHGDFTMLLAEDERVYAFTRRHEDVELLVLGNFCGEEVPVDLTGWEDAELLIGEPGGALRPWEGRVYRRYWR